MKRNPGWYAVIAAALLAVFGECARAKDEKPDLKALQGKWTAQSLVFGGENVPTEVANKLLIKISDGNATLVGGLAKLNNMYVPTARTMEYKLILGTKGDLKTLDLKEDKEGGRTIPGIYKLEKGKLILCLNYKNTDRPEKFESKEDTGIGLYEFEQPRDSK